MGRLKPSSIKQLSTSLSTQAEIFWLISSLSSGAPATSTFKKPGWFDQANQLRSERNKVKAQIDALGITLRERPKAQKAKLESQLKAHNLKPTTSS